MESVCELARFSPNPFAWRHCACGNSKNLQRGGGIVDMSDLMDDKLVATHDWRNWASCRIAGRPVMAAARTGEKPDRVRPQAMPVAVPMINRIRQIQAVGGGFSAAGLRPPYP